MARAWERNLHEHVDRLRKELLEVREELEEAYQLLAQVRFAQLDRDSCDDPHKEA